MAGWYIWQEDGASGPVGNEELAQAIRAGEISRDDWLWHDRLGEWTVAGTIDFLWRKVSTNDTAARENQAGKRARATGPRETPSLTELYLRRLKAQRGEALPRDVAADAGFIEDIASAARAAADHDGRPPAAGVAGSASVYLQGQGERATPPRSVLTGKPPPLPAQSGVTKKAARPANRPPPLPNA